MFSFLSVHFSSSEIELSSISTDTDFELSFSSNIVFRIGLSPDVKSMFVQGASSYFAKRFFVDLKS